MLDKKLKLPLQCAPKLHLPVYVHINISALNHGIGRPLTLRTKLKYLTRLMIPFLLFPFLLDHISDIHFKRRICRNWISCTCVIQYKYKTFILLSCTCVIQYIYKTFILLTYNCFPINLNAKKYIAKSFVEIEIHVHLSNLFYEMIFVLVCLATNQEVMWLDSGNQNMHKRNKNDKMVYEPGLEPYDEYTCVMCSVATDKICNKHIWNWCL
jgi:hypothetical protein